MLLITLDQFRADCAPGASARLVRTPHLDRLAASGVSFSNHWAQAAPCGPSRASLLTGRYLHTHRSAVNGTPLDDRFTNVARVARAIGYDPVLFGYTDTTVDPRTLTDPNDPRLRTYESILPGFRAVIDLPEHLRPWGEWLRKRGHDVGPDVAASMYRRRKIATPPDRGSLWPPAVYDADETEGAFLTGEIIDHLDATIEPWFVHASYLRPHPPYLVPPPFHDLYDPADVTLPHRAASIEEQGGVHPMVAAALQLDGVVAPADELEVRQFRATYYGMITEVDGQVGRLLDHLDRTGASADTVVIVTSDHGEQLGDQWFKEKLGFYDASYHIPLIVRWPGASGPAGRVIDAITENVDVFPTICDLIGTTTPRGCDGRSLRAWLDGEPPAAWRDAAHWEYDFRRPETDVIEQASGLAMSECNLAVLRDHRGKYVHFAGLPPLFFDLAEDPFETVDRAGDPAYQDRVLSYAQRMLSWRMSSDDEELSGYLATPDGMTWR